MQSFSWDIYLANISFTAKLAEMIDDQGGHGPTWLSISSVRDLGECPKLQAHSDLSFLPKSWQRS